MAWIWDLSTPVILYFFTLFYENGTNRGPLKMVKKKLPQLLSILVAIIAIIGGILSPALYIDKTYASKESLIPTFKKIETNASQIEELKNMYKANSAVICAMATDLQWTKAQEECKKFITR